MKVKNPSYVIQRYAAHSVSGRRFVQQRISEKDIIDLHELLLTNGIHVITQVPYKKFRTVMITFLDSLNYYHNVSLFTRDTMIEVPTGISVIHLDNAYHSKDYLYQFFLEDFDYDFIWIETPANFIVVLDILVELKMDTVMPILLVG